MPFKMMGKSPMSRKITGSTQAAKPGSSPAKIIPLLAGKAAALIGKKLLAKGAAKAAGKIAAKKAGTKLATKGGGKLMQKAGKNLLENQENITNVMRSKQQSQNEEEQPKMKTGATGNPFAGALKMKKSPIKVSSPYGGDKGGYTPPETKETEEEDDDAKKAMELAAKYNEKTTEGPTIKKALQKRGAAVVERGQKKGAQKAAARALNKIDKVENKIKKTKSSKKKKKLKNLLTSLKPTPAKMTVGKFKVTKPPEPPKATPIQMKKPLGKFKITKPPEPPKLTPTKMKKKSPVKKYASAAQRKAVHASKAEKKSAMKMYKSTKSPNKFNAGLKKAAAAGKLDKNPKFKAAVEKSPAKMKNKNSPTKNYKKGYYGIK